MQSNEFNETQKDEIDDMCLSEIVLEHLIEEGLLLLQVMLKKHLNLPKKGI
ncbi:hypothetical protein [Campylobacter sp. MIT 97-5078]|uniref:hypothetical protein n=1 Tax=Campylobacter sp. MIT 97-5078 TaxID=1548153 RepID=UPI000AB4D45F|nr:hypothetical protein [Campylobacter sp. MIT 97-5078]